MRPAGGHFGIRLLRAAKLADTKGTRRPGETGALLQAEETYPGLTPNAQAIAENVTNASTVLTMMMRVTRPLSAP